MSDEVTTQEAFDSLASSRDVLAKSQAELIGAVTALGGFFGGIAVAAGLIEQQVMVDRLGTLAVRAGEDLATITGEDPDPNPHILAVVEAIGNLGPWTVIDGGKIE